MKRGFSLLEIIIVVAILAIVAGISMVSFSSMKNSQTLDRDTDLVVEILRQARSQTLTSLNDTNYGVHFAPNQIVLFSGGTYDAGSGDNKIFNLSGSTSIINISLSGGGSELVFRRLSGEVEQDDGTVNTITISSSATGNFKSILIYKTGLVEFRNN